MKLLFVLCVTVFIGFVSLAIEERKQNHAECIYDDRGVCIEHCPIGTHSYTTGCGPLTPEPTCKSPHPEVEDDVICDYSACYCDPPTLRDEMSGHCVLPKDCP